MRNIIFRGRENTAEIGIEFGGAFALSDFSYITVEVHDQIYSSQDGDVIVSGDTISVDIGSDESLPPDGRYPVTVIGYSANYPLGFVLTHPDSGLDELRIVTVD